MSKIIVHAVLVFLAMVLLDWIFAFYVMHTAARYATGAGVAAAMVQLVNSFVVVSFVRDRRMVAPCVLGAFAGTWLAVTYLGGL